MGIGFLLQQAPHVFRRHMALDGVAVDKGGVAGAQTRAQLRFFLDRLQVLHLVGDHLEAAVAHIIRPFFTAAAGRRLIHFQSAGLGGLGHGQGAGHQQAGGGQ